MGTRNLTMVIDIEGSTKIAQYGQWDGYPSGQGSTVLEFLRNGDIELFKKRLSEVEFFSKEELEKLDDNWEASIKKHPWLSRDYAADILRAVCEGKWEKTDYMGITRSKEFTVDKLQDNSSFALDSLFCEWAYVIDFQKETFEVYEGFNKMLLNENDRFKYLESKMTEGDEYYPIKLVKEFKLTELPNYEEFLAVFQTEEEED